MLDKINSVVWGLPALLAIIGVGLYFTIRSGFSQLTLFGRAAAAFWGQLRVKSNDKMKSSYRALCTALAATVGTGNIVGVAGALVIGGPGSIFWMWICGFLGMIIKFAEATLAVRYRTINQQGEYVGGTMHMIQNGLGAKWKWLAVCYCVLAVFASFGVGNAAQVNAVVESIDLLFCGIPVEVRYLIGIVLALLVAIVLFGGAKRIGTLAEKLVPIAAVIYIILCLFVLALKGRNVPCAFQSIVLGAVNPKAATGGIIGSAFKALTVGASRGTFTNEAGMGTASIAHAGADVSHPVLQGLLGIWEVFLDTIVICTLTALVILCSEIKIPYGVDNSATLTIDAFQLVLGGWVKYIVTALIICFAVATIFGWSLYGIRCTQYLTGESSWKLYVTVQVVVVVLSAMIRSGSIWSFSETMNGLMLIPNLFALVCLSPELFRLITAYKSMGKYSSGNLTKIDRKW